ncbi:unnamed protein product, partial [Urochloa humidicola]
DKLKQPASGNNGAKGMPVLAGSTPASDGKGTQRPLVHLVVPDAVLQVQRQAASQLEVTALRGDQQRPSTILLEKPQEVVESSQEAMSHHGFTNEETAEMDEEDLLDDEGKEYISDDDFTKKVAELAGIPEATLLESPRMSKRRAATSADDSLDRASSLKAARNLDGIKGTFQRNTLAPVLE